MRKKNDGFTLVELLVVISIIALLLSIMMPALNRVRKNARRIVCAANMHNVSTAMMVYQNKYNSYPAITWEPEGSTDMNLRTYWWEALIMGGAIAGKEDPPGSGNWAVAKDSGWKAYSCPEALSASKDVTIKNMWAGYGFSYNNGYLSPTSGQGPNPTWLGKNPKGNIIVLIDGRDGYNSLDSTLYFFPYNPKLASWKPNGQIGIRHDIAKKSYVANSAWTDGHVETRNVKEYKPIMIDPQMNGRR
jgi:prepilin-type N-terminal cleavage/methylation domain-containing protein